MTKPDFKCPFEDQAIPKFINGDAPWPARMLVWMVTKFGLTAIILLFVLAVWAGYVPSPITESRAILGKLEASDRVHVVILRAICRHTAVSDFQRKDCDEAMESSAK